MENHFGKILGAAAGVALASCSPAQEQPVPTPTEEVAPETIELPVESTGDELEAAMKAEEYELATNNGQYTKEEVAKILSGTTKEVE